MADGIQYTISLEFRGIIQSALNSLYSLETKLDHPSFRSYKRHATSIKTVLPVPDGGITITGITVDDDFYRNISMWKPETVEIDMVGDFKINFTNGAETSWINGVFN